jgi:hypothetical protein
MINQFRLKYPQGSLISELVSTKHGKYIVKVSIILNETILSTGLAGAATVEIAEDLARERALAMIDLSESQPSPHPPVIASPSSSVMEKVTEIPSITETETTPSTKKEIPSLTKIETTPSTKKEIPSLTETEIAKSYIPTPGEDGDFVSEIIAEISIQMERLAWTKEQGKDYLLKTYGKKSRHLLSDQELLEFLNYLQNQPS